MSMPVRRDIPLMISSIIVLVSLLAFFLTLAPIKSISAELSTWTTVIYSFFLWFGCVSLTLAHAKTLVKRGENWPFSVWLLIVMWTYIVIGIGLGRLSEVYDRLYFAIAGQALVQRSLLAFWVTSATYRAFRARSVEGALLFIAGVLMMLGNAPIFSVVWPGFTAIRAWISAVPQAGGLRPVVICSGLAVIAMAIRIVFGWERGYLGER